MLKMPELGMSEKEFREIAKQISKLLKVTDSNTGYVVMRFDMFGTNMLVQNVCSGESINIIEALRVTAQTIEEATNGTEPPPLYTDRFAVPGVWYLMPYICRFLKINSISHSVGRPFAVYVA